MPDASQPYPRQLDVVIVGGGLAGLYAIHRLRKLGLKVRAYEAGSGIGGTWFWNRYPGARFDSESITYGYSFSEELLQEWHWKERFSGQPELQAEKMRYEESLGITVLPDIFMVGIDCQVIDLTRIDLDLIDPRLAISRFYRSNGRRVYYPARSQAVARRATCFRDTRIAKRD